MAEISVPGVADADPPNEIDDGEAPANGYIDAPNTRALHDQVADRKQHHHRERETNGEAHDPTHGRGTRQHNGADLVGYCGKSVSRLDDRCASAECLFLRLRCLTASSDYASISGFGLRISAR